jgi:acetone carboxylase gamma subunit
MSVQVCVTSAIGTAYVVVADAAGERSFHCARCDHEFGPVTEEPKLHAVVAERSIVEASELNRHGAVDELVLREFYCPGCGAMLAANVQRHGDPVLREIELS